MNKIDSNKGFTLVELMIVVAIIGILAAVALPQYNSYRLKSRAAKLLDYARACAMEIAADCNNNQPMGIANLGTCQPAQGNIPSGEAITVAINASTCNAIDTNATAPIGDAAGWSAICQGTFTSDINCRLIDN